MLLSSRSTTSSSSSFGVSNWLLDFLSKFGDKIVASYELILLMLLAIGFKVLRPHLNSTELRFFVGVGGIGLYLGVFECTCTTPGSCSGYKLVRDVLQAVSFLVVIIAMNFNLQGIAQQITETTASVGNKKK